MALGGVAELLFGVKAAGRQLEDIAQPLTATDAKPGVGKVAEEGEGREGPLALEVRRGGDEESDRDAAEERIRARIERRRQRERSGLCRYRPGPGGFPTARVPADAAPVSEQVLDEQILTIQRAPDEHGSTDRRQLATLVGARYWGPGVFREALRQARVDGDIRRTARSTYAPADDDDNEAQQ